MVADQAKIKPSHADIARNLREDLALCEAATPGPWEAVREKTENDDLPYRQVSIQGDSANPGPYILFPLFDALYCDEEFERFRGQAIEFDDAAMMAAAREGWPAAIRRALTAEARVKELEERFVRLEGR